MRYEIIEESVDFLFQELQKHKIQFVVLRNYSNLPDVGNDLDMAVGRENIGYVRELLCSSFMKTMWTDICEVKTHNSEIDEHCIFVFKFFNKEFDVYLQIDFFLGFSFKGQPLFYTSSFLEKPRIVNTYPVVNANVELTIKYYQILVAIKHMQWSRVEKYRKQASELTKYANEDSLSFYSLNQMLKKNEFKEYKSFLVSYRKTWLLKHFKKSPLQFVFNFISRLTAFYSFYIDDPFIVTCNLSDSNDEKVLVEVLNDFIKNKCFRYYFIASKLSFKNRIKKYLKMASSGGVIIKYKKNGEILSDKNEIKQFIIGSFIKRHTTIFSNPIDK